MTGHTFLLLKEKYVLDLTLVHTDKCTHTHTNTHVSAAQAQM
jgi:hypothetical protein